MNADGWGFLGAGTSDNRLAGMDLQHNRQTRTADELHVPVRIVTQTRESGGPMKQDMDEMQKKPSYSEHIESEKMRHEQSMGHQKHHIEKHNSRYYDSQYGQDTYQY
jgi:hypothetical protein